MQSLIVIILLLLPSLLFASESTYVFVIDENYNPVQGYKLLGTQRDDIYISKIEPIKKWITNLRSQLIVMQDGYVYSVRDSIIVDKRKGIALLLIDFSQKKPLYFNPEEVLIDRDIKVLTANKNEAYSKIKTLFPSEIKKEARKEKISDYTALAEQYEKTGQWSLALSVYEDILKHKPEGNIINKIAILYYRLGNFKKAKEYFKMLSKDEQTVARLVGICIIEKDFEEALKFIKNSGLNSAYMHYLKGILYYLIGNKDRAYKEVSILFPLNNELAQNLRDLLR
ncbi:tetratricopeptide repeat protein [Thermodesulfovibrio sp. 3907-1M]|uniref:Tetratricopeptide repeat protein n=1 Tax=Thermodesulfovibrio autotrophicus TaxID=3118333 RepID=A0AAU8GZL3_9BACT